MLRHNYVISVNLKWLVFASSICDMGLIRPEIKKLFPLKVISCHSSSNKNLTMSLIKRFKHLFKAFHFLMAWSDPKSPPNDPTWSIMSSTDLWRSKYNFFLSQAYYQSAELHSSQISLYKCSIGQQLLVQAVLPG